MSRDHVQCFERFEDYLDWISAGWDLFNNQQGLKRHRPRRMAPLHPGRILQQDYLTPKRISQSELARRIGCTHAKVNEIIAGKRSITVSFALDLESRLGTPADYWLLLQLEYDLWQQRQERRHPA